MARPQRHSPPFRMAIVSALALGVAVIAAPSLTRAQSPTAPTSAAWHDSAPVHASFIEVDKNVRLEVLDWGGTGRPIVLLSGLGNTAHIYDSFAPKLTANYHVYGITRRGYGASSVPSSGYGADRLGDDVLAVLSALRISRPVLMGHSIAGEELSSIGSRHADQVSGLVYLDATYYYAYQNPSKTSFQAPFEALGPRVMGLAFTPATPADLANFPAVQLWSLRGRGVLFPEADFHEVFETDTNGHITGNRTPPAVPQAIMAGVQKYTQIRAPILAFCAIPQSYGQTFGKGDQAAAEKFLADEETLLREQTDAFQAGNPSAHVVRLPHANHYVFLSNEDDVLRETNSFISKLP